MSAPPAFWDWALAAYARPGVAAACLQLQDAGGQNVPLLLWAAWAQPADPARIAAAVDLAKGWDAQVVTALRGVRRALKSPAAGIDDQAREALRDQVKAVELAAEKVLMQALEALAPKPADTPELAHTGVAQALTAAADAWNGQADAAMIAVLAQRLV